MRAGIVRAVRRLLPIKKRPRTTFCPDHQTPYQRLSEENYYFKASAFTLDITKAIESGKMKIVPNFRKEFLELIKDGLADVSVSRPAKSLSWGVPVPSDPNQVMYVWLDT